MTEIDPFVLYNIPHRTCEILIGNFNGRLNDRLWRGFKERTVHLFVRGRRLDDVEPWTMIFKPRVLPPNTRAMTHTDAAGKQWAVRVERWPTANFNDLEGLLIGAMPLPPRCGVCEGRGYLGDKGELECPRCLGYGFYREVW